MGVILTDLLTLTSFSNKTSSGEADLLTGRDLDRGLALFTELTPGVFLVREDVRFVGVQLCLLRMEDLRVTGGGGL